MLDADITRAEVAARIRAAIGYSGKELDELYAELGKGYSPATLRRMYLEDRKDFKGASIDELHAIADVCGVPHAFMHEGFDRFASDAVLAARVEAQATQVVDLIERLEEHIAAVDERFNRLEEGFAPRAALAAIDRRLAAVEQRTKPLTRTPISAVRAEIRELRRRVDSQRPAPEHQTEEDRRKKGA